MQIEPGRSSGVEDLRRVEGSKPWLSFRQPSVVQRAVDEEAPEMILSRFLVVLDLNNP